MERGRSQARVRRADEMGAAAQLLDELGVPARVTEASLAWLEQFARQAGVAPPPRTPS